MTNVRSHTVSVIDRTRPVAAGAPVVAAHFLGRTAVFVLGEEALLFVEPEAGRAMEEFVPTEPGMANRVTVGDYAVRYPDGFKSVSPQKAFTDGYTLNETLNE